MNRKQGIRIRFNQYRRHTFRTSSSGIWTGHRDSGKKSGQWDIGSSIRTKSFEQQQSATNQSNKQRSKFTFHFEFDW